MSNGIIAAIEVILDLGWRFFPIIWIRRYRATEFSKCLRRYAFAVSRFPPRYEGATPFSVLFPPHRHLLRFMTYVLAKEEDRRRVLPEKLSTKLYRFDWTASRYYFEDTSFVFSKAYFFVAGVKLFRMKFEVCDFLQVSDHE